MVKNLEIIEQAIDFLKTGLWDNNPDTIKSMLFEFISQNTDPVAGFKKLSVWDCVADSEKDSVFNYAYLDHLKKVAVATNGKVIFINPDEYKVTASVENGEVINKDYSNHECDGYPDYTKAIPADEEMEDVALIPAADMANFAKQAMVVGMLSGNENPCIQVIGDNHESLVGVNFIPYILTAGTDGWKKHKAKPIYVKKYDGKTLVIVGKVILKH